MSEPGRAPTYRLLRHADALAVVRLGPGADVPGWATSATLFSVTATAVETTLVCHASSVPAKARPQGPFLAYEVEGPLDFSLTGVLAALLAPLTDAAVSVFVVSTFDTDWILVDAAAADRADEAWAQAGHEVAAAPDPAPRSSR